MSKTQNNHHFTLNWSWWILLVHIFFGYLRVLLSACLCFILAVASILLVGVHTFRSYFSLSLSGARSLSAKCFRLGTLLYFVQFFNCFTLDIASIVNGNCIKRARKKSRRRADKKNDYEYIFPQCIYKCVCVHTESSFIPFTLLRLNLLFIHLPILFFFFYGTFSAG